jgi:hypothetical protein
MYPTADLLKDCQRLLKELEKDLRAQADGDAALAAQYAAARKSGTTGIAIGAWLSEQVTQAAVAWVLATVFVRFLEDNRLIDQTSGEITAWISGPDDADQTRSRLKAATLAREAYITKHPDHSDVQYLLHVVREVGRLPACRDLFAEDRNPLFRLQVSADGAKRILAFWREQDQSGAVIRVLTTEKLADTRWLGDLYQDLSADARKRFALLQTPDFVEEFILDYTLTPAIQTFGLEGLRGIDPTCGSGHFLLGMFHRLWHAWEQQLGPGVPVKESVRRAMSSIYGIDLNPFAVAISRFRLMIAGLMACGYTRMKDCPDFGFTLAVGNTLLVGTQSGGGGGFQPNFLAESGIEHSEVMTPGDYAVAKRLLTQRYHAVVGNPPYIAVKDGAERDRIKPQYKSCFKKWTLSVPFTERFFYLAQDGVTPDTKAVRPAGFVGLINSNNFTKREFGKALIEQVLPSLDLTHVIDTSGCYIPGHGTPTVILFGRNQIPSAKRPVRAVQGIRGEPGRPDDAAHGKVWTAMVENIGKPGSETPWLSVADVDRSVFGQHPWSLGGGGASELKALVEGIHAQCAVHTQSNGYAGFPAADDVFVQERHVFSKIGAESAFVRPFFEGENIRDWSFEIKWHCFFPYSEDRAFALEAPSKWPKLHRFLWAFRSSLWSRPEFGGQTYRTAGEPWWKWHQTSFDKFATRTAIAYGQISTHNHFSQIVGDYTYKQSASIIKLSAEATEDDHLALLSCLNSSTASFWFRQVCFPKGGDKMGDGARVTPEAFAERLAHNSTNIEKTPIPEALRPERIALTRRLDALGQELAALQPSRLFATQAPARQLLDRTAARVVSIRAEMVFLQEELDWLIYRAYGIITETECPRSATDTVPLALGERAFEIDLARKAEAEEEETTWFSNHRSLPITDIPASWPTAYQQVVQRRLDLIASHPHIGLLEKPEHKRRWQSDPWNDVVQRGLRDWLCDQLESRRLWPAEPALISTTTLADRAFRDTTFAQVAVLYRGNDHFDQHELIRELVTDESVPALPVQRYTDDGLIKRADWERTWDLQRREDAGETVDIPVPPRYSATDFQKASYWSHRGKLDVPKERFVSYPGAAPDGDAGLLVLWAGYNHLEHTQALIAHYQWAKDQPTWTPAQAIPLLASLHQLIPWLKQWHNDLDPTHGARLGDSYAEFLATECHELNVTVKDLRAWKPTVVSRVANPKRSATSDNGDAPKTRGRPKKTQA